MRQILEYKIYPIDTNRNKAVGIKLPFNQKGIFGVNYTTQDQVKTNLTNFMLTSPGERVYNLNYGAGLRELLFSPGDNINEIRQRIIDRITVYFPQIKLLNLDFNQVDSIIYINLKYSFNKLEDQLLIGLQL